MTRSPISFRSVVTTLILFTSFRASSAADLIVNGGFESGNLSGWTAVSQFSNTSYDENSTPAASGFFAQNTSETTSLSGLSTLGPASGSFYALADSTAPGANVLIQNFTVPQGTTSLNLSFDMFTYDWYGAGATGSSLNYLDDPNQHVRVDLLKFDAPDYDTSATYVVVNLFDGLQNNTSPPTWQNYAFDLLPYVTPGSNYRLRFGAVDNQFVLNMGVDNVALVVVPEPSSILLAASSILALAIRCNRRNSNG